MAFSKQYDTPEPVTEPPCLHLRSKAMYVTGSRTPSHPDEVGSHGCWCNLTQHIIGPDRGEVDYPACVPGRDCYRRS